MSDGYVLWGQAGSGSVAVEAALTLAGRAYETVDTRGAAVIGQPWNPLGLVPALKLPSGEIMTESAAILLWLAETHPEAMLAPDPGSAARAAFLCWMSFVSSAVYALYWVRDDPSRVTGDPEARKEVKTALNQRIADCWGVIEGQVKPGRYILGDDLSVLDLYVTVVSRWAPRQALHEEIAPRIGEVVRRVESDPRLAELWARRFPLRDEDD